MDSKQVRNTYFTPHVPMSEMCEDDDGWWKQATADGWRFEYSDATRFVGAVHENGRGKFSVCEVVTPVSRGDAFRLAVGQAIADMMNDRG